MKRENTAINYNSESKDEIVGVLTAISVVSKRLARRLAQLEKLPEKRGSRRNDEASEVARDTE